MIGTIVYKASREELENTTLMDFQERLPSELRYQFQLAWRHKLYSFVRQHRDLECAVVTLDWTLELKASIAMVSFVVGVSYRGVTGRKLLAHQHDERQVPMTVAFGMIQKRAEEVMSAWEGGL